MWRNAPTMAAIFLFCWPHTRWLATGTAADVPTNVWYQQNDAANGGETWSDFRNEPPLIQLPNSNAQMPPSLQPQANSYHQPFPRKAQQVDPGRVETQDVKRAFNQQMGPIQRFPPTQNRVPNDRTAAVGNSIYSTLPVYAPLHEEIIQRDSVGMVPRQIPSIQSPLRNNAVYSDGSQPPLPIKNIPSPPVSPQTYEGTYPIVYGQASPSNVEASPFILPWNSVQDRQFPVPYSNNNPSFNYRSSIDGQGPERGNTGPLSNTGMFTTFNSGGNSFFPGSDKLQSQKFFYSGRGQELPAFKPPVIDTPIINTFPQNPMNNLQTEPRPQIDRTNHGVHSVAIQSPEIIDGVGNFYTDTPQPKLPPQFPFNFHQNQNNYNGPEKFNEQNVKTNGQMASGPGYKMSNLQTPLHPMAIPSVQPVMKKDVLGPRLPYPPASYTPNTLVNPGDFGSLTAKQIVPLPPMSQEPHYDVHQPNILYSNRGPMETQQPQPLANNIDAPTGFFQMSSLPINEDLRTHSLHQMPTYAQSYESRVLTDGPISKDNRFMNPEDIEPFSISSRGKYMISSAGVSQMVRPVVNAGGPQNVVPRGLPLTDRINENAIPIEQRTSPGIMNSKAPNYVQSESHRDDFKIEISVPTLEDSTEGNKKGPVFQRLPIFSVVGDTPLDFPLSSQDWNAPYASKISNLPYGSAFQFITPQHHLPPIPMAVQRDSSKMISDQGGHPYIPFDEKSVSPGAFVSSMNVPSSRATVSQNPPQEEITRYLEQLNKPQYPQPVADWPSNNLLADAGSGRNANMYDTKSGTFSDSRNYFMRGNINKQLTEDNFESEANKGHLLYPGTNGGTSYSMSNSESTGEERKQISGSSGPEWAHDGKREQFHSKIQDQPDHLDYTYSRQNGRAVIGENIKSSSRYVFENLDGVEFSQTSAAKAQSDIRGTGNDKQKTIPMSVKYDEQNMWFPTRLSQSLMDTQIPGVPESKKEYSGPATIPMYNQRGSLDANEGTQTKFNKTRQELKKNEIINDTEINSASARDSNYKAPYYLHSQSHYHSAEKLRSSFSSNSTTGSRYLDNQNAERNSDTIIDGVYRTPDSYQREATMYEEEHPSEIIDENYIEEQTNEKMNSKINEAIMEDSTYQNIKPSQTLSHLSPSQLAKKPLSNLDRSIISPFADDYRHAKPSAQTKLNNQHNTSSKLNSQTTYSENNSFSEDGINVTASGQSMINTRAKDRTYKNDMYEDNTEGSIDKQHASNKLLLEQKQYFERVSSAGWPYAQGNADEWEKPPQPVSDDTSRPSSFIGLNGLIKPHDKFSNYDGRNIPTENPSDMQGRRSLLNGNVAPTTLNPLMKETSGKYSSEDLYARSKQRQSNSPYSEQPQKLQSFTTSQGFFNMGSLSQAHFLGEEVSDTRTNLETQQTFPTKLKADTFYNTKPPTPASLTGYDGADLQPQSRIDGFARDETVYDSQYSRPLKVITKAVGQATPPQLQKETIADSTADTYKSHSIRDELYPINKSEAINQDQQRNSMNPSSKLTRLKIPHVPSSLSDSEQAYWIPSTDNYENTNQYTINVQYPEYTDMPVEHDHERLAGNRNMLSTEHDDHGEHVKGRTEQLIQNELFVKQPYNAKQSTLGYATGSDGMLFSPQTVKNEFEGGMETTTFHGQYKAAVKLMSEVQNREKSKLSQKLSPNEKPYTTKPLSVPDDMYILPNTENDQQRIGVNQPPDFPNLYKTYALSGNSNADRAPHPNNNKNTKQYTVNIYDEHHRLSSQTTTGVMHPEQLPVEYDHERLTGSRIISPNLKDDIIERIHKEPSLKQLNDAKSSRPYSMTVPDRVDSFPQTVDNEFEERVGTNTFHGQYKVTVKFPSEEDPYREGSKLSQKQVNQQTIEQDYQSTIVSEKPRTHENSQSILLNPNDQKHVTMQPSSKTQAQTTNNEYSNTNGTKQDSGTTAYNGFQGHPSTVAKYLENTELPVEYDHERLTTQDKTPSKSNRLPTTDQFRQNEQFDLPYNAKPSNSSSMPDSDKMYKSQTVDKESDEGYIFPKTVSNEFEEAVGATFHGHGQHKVAVKFISEDTNRKGSKLSQKEINRGNMDDKYESSRTVIGKDLDSNGRMRIQDPTDQDPNSIQTTPSNFNTKNEDATKQYKMTEDQRRSPTLPAETNSLVSSSYVTLQTESSIGILEQNDELLGDQSPKSHPYSGQRALDEKTDAGTYLPIINSLTLNKNKLKLPSVAKLSSDEPSNSKIAPNVELETQPGERNTMMSSAVRYPDNIDLDYEESTGKVPPNMSGRSPTNAYNDPTAIYNKDLIRQQDPSLKQQALPGSDSTYKIHHTDDYDTKKQYTITVYDNDRERASKSRTKVQYLAETDIPVENRSLTGHKTMIPNMSGISHINKYDEAKVKFDAEQSGHNEPSLKELDVAKSSSMLNSESVNFKPQMVFEGDGATTSKVITQASLAGLKDQTTYEEHKLLSKISDVLHPIENSNRVNLDLTDQQPHVTILGDAARLLENTGMPVEYEQERLTEDRNKITGTLGKSLTTESDFNVKYLTDQERYTTSPSSNLFNLNHRNPSSPGFDGTYLSADTNSDGPRNQGTANVFAKPPSSKLTTLLPETKLSSEGTSESNMLSINNNYFDEQEKGGATTLVFQFNANVPKDDSEAMVAMNQTTPLYEQYRQPTSTMIKTSGSTKVRQSSKLQSSQYLNVPVSMQSQDAVNEQTTGIIVDTTMGSTTNQIDRPSKILANPNDSAFQSSGQRFVDSGLESTAEEQTNSFIGTTSENRRIYGYHTSEKTFDSQSIPHGVPTGIKDGSKTNTMTPQSTSLNSRVPGYKAILDDDKIKYLNYAQRRPGSVQVMATYGSPDDETVFYNQVPSSKGATTSSTYRLQTTEERYTRSDDDDSYDTTVRNQVTAMKYDDSNKPSSHPDREPPNGLPLTSNTLKSSITKTRFDDTQEGVTPIEFSTQIPTTFSESFIASGIAERDDTTFTKQTSKIRGHISSLDGKIITSGGGIITHIENSPEEYAPLSGSRTISAEEGKNGMPSKFQQPLLSKDETRIRVEYTHSQDGIADEERLNYGGSSSFKDFAHDQSSQGNRMDDHKNKPQPLPDFIRKHLNEMTSSTSTDSTYSYPEPTKIFTAQPDGLVSESDSNFKPTDLYKEDISAITKPQLPTHQRITDMYHDSDVKENSYHATSSRLASRKIAVSTSDYITVEATQNNENTESTLQGGRERLQGSDASETDLYPDRYRNSVAYREWQKNIRNATAEDNDGLTSDNSNLSHEKIQSLMTEKSQNHSKLLNNYSDHQYQNSGKNNKRLLIDSQRQLENTEDQGVDGVSSETGESVVDSVQDSQTYSQRRRKPISSPISLAQNVSSNDNSEMFSQDSTMAAHEVSSTASFDLLMNGIEMNKANQTSEVIKSSDTLISRLKGTRLHSSPAHSGRPFSLGNSPSSHDQDYETFKPQPEISYRNTSNRNILLSTDSKVDRLVNTDSEGNQLNSSYLLSTESIKIKQPESLSLVSHDQDETYRTAIDTLENKMTNNTYDGEKMILTASVKLPVTSSPILDILGPSQLSVKNGYNDSVLEDSLAMDATKEYEFNNSQAVHLENIEAAKKLQLNHDLVIGMTDINQADVNDQTSSSLKGTTMTQSGWKKVEGSAIIANAGRQSFQDRLLESSTVSLNARTADQGIKDRTADYNLEIISGLKSSGQKGMDSTKRDDDRELYSDEDSGQETSKENMQGNIINITMTQTGWKLRHHSLQQLGVDKHIENLTHSEEPHVPLSVSFSRAGDSGLPNTSEQLYPHQSVSASSPSNGLGTNGQEGTRPGETNSMVSSSSSTSQPESSIILLEQNEPSNLGHKNLKTQIYSGQRALSEEADEETDLSIQNKSKLKLSSIVPVEPSNDSIVTNGELETRSGNANPKVSSTKQPDHTESGKARKQSPLGADTEPTVIVEISPSSVEKMNTVLASHLPSATRAESSIDLLEQNDKVLGQLNLKTQTYSGQRTLSEEADEETDSSTQNKSKLKLSSSMPVGPSNSRIVTNGELETRSGDASPKVSSSSSILQSTRSIDILEQNDKVLGQLNLKTHAYPGQSTLDQKVTELLDHTESSTVHKQCPPETDADRTVVVKIVQRPVEGINSVPTSNLCSSTSAENSVDLLDQNDEVLGQLKLKTQAQSGQRTLGEDTDEETNFSIQNKSKLKLPSIIPVKRSNSSIVTNVELETRSEDTSPSVSSFPKILIPKSSIGISEQNDKTLSQDNSKTHTYSGQHTLSQKVTEQLDQIGSSVVGKKCLPETGTDPVVVVKIVQRPLEPLNSAVLPGVPSTRRPECPTTIWEQNDKSLSDLSLKTDAYSGRGSSQDDTGGGTNLPTKSPSQNKDKLQLPSVTSGEPQNESIVPNSESESHLGETTPMVSSSWSTSEHEISIDMAKTGKGTNLSIKSPRQNEDKLKLASVNTNKRPNNSVVPNSESGETDPKEYISSSILLPGSSVSSLEQNGKFVNDPSSKAYHSFGEQTGDGTNLPTETPGQNKDESKQPSVASRKPSTSSVVTNSESESVSALESSIDVIEQNDKVVKAKAYSGQRTLGEDTGDESKLQSAPPGEPSTFPKVSSFTGGSQPDNSIDMAKTGKGTNPLKKSASQTEDKSELSSVTPSDPANVSIVRNSESEGRPGETNRRESSSSSIVQPERSIDILEQNENILSRQSSNIKTYSGQRTLGQDTGKGTDLPSQDEAKSELPSVTSGEPPNNSILPNSRPESRPGETNQKLSSSSSTSKPDEPLDIVEQNKKELGNPSSKTYSHSSQHTSGKETGAAFNLQIKLPYMNKFNPTPISLEDLDADGLEYQNALRTLSNINSGNFKLFTAEYFIQLIQRCNCASLKFLIPLLQRPNSGILVTS